MTKKKATTRAAAPRAPVARVTLADEELANFEAVRKFMQGLLPRSKPSNADVLATALHLAAKRVDQGDQSP